MRQVIGFSLMFSGFLFLLYSPIFLWVTMLKPHPHYEIFIGIIIYSIVAIIISYKIWWTHKE